MIRIVQLTFEQEFIETFKTIFENTKQKIASMQGCNGVQLLQDKNDERIFFTYSKWDSEAHLEAYRVSEVFESTWKSIKPHFANKPQAWSVDSINHS